jgi:hypothetical protein
MADFCNKCSNEMFGEDSQPDIDVYEISKTLKPGYYQPVLCEGCVMVAVAKNDEGLIEIAREGQDGQINFIPLEEWEKLKETV